MKYPLTIATLSALVLAGAAAAGDWQAKFDGMDTDSNGVVTEAEFTAYKTADGETSAEDASEQFAQLAGEDGELTLAELEAAMSTSGGETPSERDGY